MAAAKPRAPDFAVLWESPLFRLITAYAGSSEAYVLETRWGGGSWRKLENPSRLELGVLADQLELYFEGLPNSVDSKPLCRHCRQRFEDHKVIHTDPPMHKCRNGPPGTPGFNQPFLAYESEYEPSLIPVIYCPVCTVSIEADFFPTHWRCNSASHRGACPDLPVTFAVAD